MKSIGSIGVLLPELADPLDYELLQGIQTQAFRLGYDTIVLSGIYNSQTEMFRDDYMKGLENIYSLIEKARLTGVLFVLERFRNQTTIQQIVRFLTNSDIPSLVLGESCLPFRTIYPRQQESIRRLTRHLIDTHGCKKLYCITGFSGHRSSEERTAGFRQAMHEAGCSMCESDIFYGNFWSEIPHRIGEQIADGTLAMPDGIVCASDTMALAVIRGLVENGIRVPEDVRVTGYDGGLESWLYSPKITTAFGRDQQFGEDAVCRLHEMITGFSVGYSEYRQGLRYAESCGCNNAGKSINDSAIIGEYLRTHIRHSTEKKQFFTANLIDRMRSAETLADWCKLVDNVGHILPGWKWLDICLCSDWCADSEHPESFRQQGFSDRMLLALSKRRGVNDMFMYDFPTADILPALCKSHETKLVFLTSLHMHGQVFGYLATTYASPYDIQADEFYINWSDAVANGLFAVQQHINVSHIREQVELLTVNDPETGLFNWRGVAEHLSEMLQAAHRQQTIAQIALVTYHATKQDTGYEPSALLASALRHCAPEGTVCARMRENVFAVLHLKSQMNPDELLMRVETRLNDLLGETAPSPVLILSTLPLQFQTLSDTERGISDALDALAQQAFGSGGYYDYKEQFSRLRHEILTNPQKDWNVTDMACSVGVSSSHLHRLYKQFFKVSCLEDIITSRMNRAQQLLAYTHLHIQEIALQCGYKNDSHFMRQFKKRFGMTAVQYRNLNRK